MATKRRTRADEFSNPFLVQEVRFNSSPAQSAFKSGYGDCDIALRGISAALPVIVKNENEIMAVSGAVDHLINGVFAEIRAEAARIKKISEDNGIELGMVNYTNALSFEVQITSSKSGQYLQMIRELDNLIGLLHAAWLAGFISDDQKAKLERQWRRKVLSVSSEIKEISIRAFRAAQKSNEVVEQDDLDKDEQGKGDESALVKKPTTTKPTKAKKTAKKSGIATPDTVVQPDAPAVSAALPAATDNHETAGESVVAG